MKDRTIYLVFMRGLNAATLIQVFARRESAEAFARKDTRLYVLSWSMIL